jgi:hypothetical protein
MKNIKGGGKLEFLPNQHLQIAISKNPHCLSGGKK